MKSIEKKDSATGLNKIYVDLNYPKQDSIFSYKIELKTMGDYSVNIETTLIYDSIFLNKYYYSGGNKSVLSQKLTFKYKDSVISQKELPYANNNYTHLLLQKKKIKLYKYVATNFLYKDTLDNPLYVFYAFDLSNGSNEISFYFSKDGELICMTDCNRRSCDSTGNFQILKSKFSMVESTKLPQVCIFPPQCAGKTDW